MVDEAWHGALIGVSLIGALNAAYFVAVTYRWMRPDPRWLPNVCRMDQDACAKIVDVKAARVLGLPNAVYGAAWYAIVAAAAGTALAGHGTPFCLPLLTVAVATVLLSLYLAWVLLVRLKTPCVLCFLGHTVNVAILGLLVVVCAP